MTPINLDNKDKHNFDTHLIKVPSILKHIAISLLITLLVSILILFFAPWIQTARGKGVVTTLDPHDRAQNITALVSGRIKKWYVHEGDFVQKGKPILEIIDNDADLIERILIQMQAYERNLHVAEIASRTAKLNYDRQDKLFKQGLASQLTVEKAKINYKQYLAKQQEAIAKLKEAESKVSRQERQLITAPRDGTIIRITAGDTATSVKTGDNLAILVPTNIEPAIALFMNGLDIALITSGQKVRLQFEGWPSVQFSGWPSKAIGTFGGVVHSVDPSVHSNGKFRILVKPDPDDPHPWPDNRYLHYGARAKGWVLLDQVPVGYELWRQLNDFPPEYPKSLRKKDTMNKM